MKSPVKEPHRALLKPGEKPVSKATLKLRLLKRLKCTLKYEKLAWSSGAKHVAGVDEVGRGSLFGPVVAAAVILDPSYRIRGLRDSKMLNREQREKLAPKIREHSLAKVPFLLVVGDKEVESGRVNVRTRGKEETEVMPS